ncbi:DUF6270 domain-containing protein [uncultured Amphritea sp.]|uniref:DUF6270 domain-containing protein n=1 Tax=uncultured Amphritea sp. TaxID=981605 RepID=UPI0026126CED|nr:DUF6270 domain-containing protein [uncultured Amphritea sp.]
MNGINILIFGSCVSRDIISHMQVGEVKLNLVDYYARSSLASLNSQWGCELPVCLNSIQSPFQRRMIERDITKSFFKDLDDLDFDILLIDLIDERFNLWVGSQDNIVTLSGELMQCGFLYQNKGEIVISGTEEHWELWENGWSVFVKVLQDHGCVKKLRLNKVFWSKKTESGVCFSGNYTEKKIDQSNLLLRRMYERIEEDIPEDQILCFPKYCQTSADTHKWGISPFHYVDDYYSVAQCKIVESNSERKITNKNLIVGSDIMYPVDAYDVSTWKARLYQYGSAYDAVTDGLDCDGIHQILLEKELALDLYLQGIELLKGDIKDPVILVGLSGAVSGRNGKKAPFFSGLGIAESLSMPIVSVSDPTLALDSELPLSWYAGNEITPDLPLRIANVLDRIAHKYSARLVVFGGSGGGYAGLMLATMMSCRATVCVWNPQTSISDYVPVFVAKYLTAAFPSMKMQVDAVLKDPISTQNEKFKQLLEDSGVLHDVRGLNLQPQIDLVYLQNQSDWHVAKHTLPFLSKKAWTRIGEAAFKDKESDQIGLFFGDWGEGHAAPDKVTIENLLNLIINQLSKDEILLSLDNGLSEDGLPVSRFDWCVVNADLNLQVSAWIEVDKVYACTTVDIDSQDSLGLKYAFYLLVNGQREEIRWYDACCEVIFEIPSVEGKFEILAFVRDVFGGQTSLRVLVENFFSPAEIYQKYTNRPMLGETSLVFDEFVFLLVENLKNLTEIRQDWRSFNEHRGLDDVLSGEVILATGCEVPVDKEFKINWELDFENNTHSNILWLYSLEFVGSLLSGYDSTRDERFVTAAIGIVRGFLDFLEDSEVNESLIMSLRNSSSSKDHAVVVRTNVLMKLLSVLLGKVSDFVLIRRIAALLYSQCLFLLDDSNYALTNHGVMADLALAQLGAALGGNDTLQGDFIVNKSKSRLITAINRTFDKDGFANENTVGYHRFNMFLFRDAIFWFQKWKIDGDLSSIASPIIERANTALKYLVWPDGSIPPIGDSPVYKSAANSINKSRLFKESHIAVIKSDDLYVSIICGRRGDGHKQVDDTSITIRYFNNDIVIDGGSYKYDSKDQYRQCIQSSFGHSGIFLTDLDGMTPQQYLQLKPEAKIVSFVENKFGVDVVTEIKFSKWGATLQRKVRVIWPNKIIISDLVDIAENFSPKTARQSWLLGRKMVPVDCNDVVSNRLFKSNDGVVTAKFCFLDQGGLESDEEYEGEIDSNIRGWCSEIFGEILPTREYSRYQTGMVMKFHVEIFLEHSLDIT